MRDVIIYFMGDERLWLTLSEQELRGLTNWLNGSGHLYIITFRGNTHLIRRQAISYMTILESVES